MGKKNYVINCSRCDQRFRFDEQDRALTAIIRCPDCGGSLYLSLTGEQNEQHPPLRRSRKETAGKEPVEKLTTSETTGPLNLSGWENGGASSTCCSFPFGLFGWLGRSLY
jgi:DNA-directed RNA polymerase subunit RPC12/RpoP